MKESVDNKIMQKEEIKKIPRLVYAVNLAASALFWIILYLGASTANAWRDLAAVLIVSGLFYYLFYRFREVKKIMAACLAFSFFVFMYVIIAESLFVLENSLGLKISRQLHLGARLQKRAEQRLDESARNDHMESFGEDRLAYRRVPGSIHRAQYDGRGQQYEVTVDETGFLNSDRGGYNSRKSIDIFVSGDSVMQGVGMPSCMEAVKARFGSSLSLWNLSAGSFGPRQKVAALMKFGLPKNPKYIVVEFYSGNDASEANENDVIGLAGKSFELRFSKTELEVMFQKSNKFKSILHDKGQLHLSILSIRVNSLALSLTYKLSRSLIQRPSPAAQADGGSRHHVVFPAYSHFHISSGNGGYEKWISLGVENTLKQYRKLLTRVRGMKQRPEIILMYNPSSYEICRGILVKIDEVQDRRAEMQLSRLQSFAHDNGIIFLNLLPSFRRRVQDAVGEEKWLFGQSDSIHWSRKGTEVAAGVIFEELDRIVGFEHPKD